MTEEKVSSPFFAGGEVSGWTGKQLNSPEEVSVVVVTGRGAVTRLTRQEQKMMNRFCSEGSEKRPLELQGGPTRRTRG